MSALRTMEEIMDIGEKLCVEYSKRIDEMEEGTSIEAFKENLESIRTIQQKRELSLRENVKKLTTTLNRLEDETKRLKDENGVSIDKSITDLVNSKNAAFEKLNHQISRRKEIYSNWEYGKGGASDANDPLFELESTINNLENVLFPMVYKKLSFLVTVSKIVFKDETLNGTGVLISDSFCGCESSGDLKPFSFSSVDTSPVEKADYLWSLIN